ncbi:hypothetical protein MHLP_03300 [Candidatus Mycoplasma haematolamae str. Purdue]|uniref:Uncharacterized protein n=1 Tax=Mycoplasma haematolamae (strain Purdue) TaxID=1212765 RepID=I7BAB9_MYCHA|nr:hypothetical protein [Candidatus Mycoplasma haematolamae]AFO52240.1 hypothetical protein MHLP_03300 [Candidatus Mycoplasma haematolamae str. Purdue]
MFPFAKIVGSSLGFLTVGSTGVAVTPNLFAAGSDFLYKERNKKQNYFNLAFFESEEQTLRQKLEELSKKLNSGLKATESLKEEQIKNIKTAFELVKKNELSLKQKYQEIAAKVQQLTQWLEKESKVAEQKMKTTQTIELLNFYEKAFKKISEKFKEWDDTVYEIICEINRVDKSSKNCKEEAEKSSLKGILTAIVKGIGQTSDAPPRSEG